MRYNDGMVVVMGADHGGFKMKEKLRVWLEKKGWEVDDVGAKSFDGKDDFVDYGKKVAVKVMEEKEVRGIVLCRNGVGMDIVSNRHGGVRCVLGFDNRQVKRARRDDDVNVLAIPADYVSTRKAKGLVGVFLKTKFSGKKRYKRRLKKLVEIDV